MKRFFVAAFIFSLTISPASAATKSLAKDPRISAAATFSDVNICKTTDATNDGWISSGFPRPEKTLTGKSNASILILPVNFPDYKFVKSDRDSYEASFKAAAAFYSKMSFGRFSVKYEFAPEALWVNFSESAYKYGVTNNLPQQDHVDFLNKVFETASPELNLTKYDSILVVTNQFRSTGIGQAWGGVKFQTKSGVITSAMLFAGRGGTAWTSFAHELGHALFGLEDLYLFQTPRDGTVQSTNTINGWDLMSGYTPDFTSWNKLLMGFIFDNEIKCLTNKNKKVIYLSHLSKSGVPKLGVINLEPGLSLCFESKKDFDGSVGLLIYRVDTHFNHGNAPYGGIPELIKSGKSYSDLGYKFKVLGTDTSGLLVQVS